MKSENIEPIETITYHSLLCKQETRFLISMPFIIITEQQQPQQPQGDTESSNSHGFSFLLLFVIVLLL
jgi:hypothetical protein